MRIGEGSCAQKAGMVSALSAILWRFLLGPHMPRETIEGNTGLPPLDVPCTCALEQALPSAGGVLHKSGPTIPIGLETPNIAGGRDRRKQPVSSRLESLHCLRVVLQESPSSVRGMAHHLTQDS